jgi:hypothetical protein
VKPYAFSVDAGSFDQAKFKQPFRNACRDKAYARHGPLPARKEPQLGLAPDQFQNQILRLAIDGLSQADRPFVGAGPSVRFSRMRYAFTHVRPPRSPARSVGKYDGLRAVQKDAIFQIVVNGAGEDASLDVPPFSNQILRAVGMRNSLDILLDDRPFIEILSDVMGGCANELYASRVSLMVRLRSLESRKKRVMDVDAAHRQFAR